MRKLTIQIDNARELQVAVVMEPGEVTARPPPVVPLEQWPTTLQKH